MKAKTTTNAAGEVIQVLEVSQGRVEVCLLGESPFLCNRPSEKARQDLLYPRAGKLTAVEKAARPKHNPVAEYRASVYRLLDPDAPTLLAMAAAAFKGAMMTAALDLPGIRKTQIGRLTYVEGDYVPIYGVPQLHMAVVRQAGIERTPDIRTRAIVPAWATRLSIRFIEPTVTPQAVVNLLAAGGLVAGVGDGRIEKGKLSYGMFRVVSADDPAFLRVVEAGGRVAQLAALDCTHPVCYDQETADLLSWFDDELARRQKEGRSGSKAAKQKEAAA